MKVADDAVPVAAEAQRIAIGVPDDGGPAHGDKTLNHDGQDVLAAHQAAIKEGETRGHQHDQAGAQNHETGISGIEMKHAILQPRCLEVRPRMASRGSALMNFRAGGGPLRPIARKALLHREAALGPGFSAVRHITSCCET